MASYIKCIPNKTDIMLKNFFGNQAPPPLEFNNYILTSIHYLCQVKPELFIVIFSKSLIRDKLYRTMFTRTVKSGLETRIIRLFP